MAFLHHWRGHAWGSGVFSEPNRADTWTFDDPQPLTILRVRAFAQAVHADSPCLPAFYAGNDIPPLVFRVLIVDGDVGPSMAWPDNINSALATDDDVIFESMPWGTPVYVPQNVGFGRDELVHTYATVAGGIADSKAQRSFPLASTPKLYWNVGYPLTEEGGSPVLPDFTCNVWIRVLMTGPSL